MAKPPSRPPSAHGTLGKARGLFQRRSPAAEPRLDDSSEVSRDKAQGSKLLPSPSLSLGPVSIMGFHPGKRGKPFQVENLDFPFSRVGFQNSLNWLDVAKQCIDAVVCSLLCGEMDIDRSSELLDEKFHEKSQQIDLRAYADQAKRGQYGAVSEADQSFIETSFEQAMADWQNEQRFIAFLKDRLSGKDDSLSSPSTVQRLERLTAYAREYGDAAAKDYARLIFPEWEIPSSGQAAPIEAHHTTLPTEAPEIYQGLRGPETPPAFVKRVYGPWLGQGLDRAHIRHLDPTLSTAINNWLSRPGNEWPADVDLPTRGEQNRRMVEQLRAEAPDGRIGKVIGDFTAREAQRVRSAARKWSKTD